MDQAQRELIVKKLDEKNAKLPCPRCGHNKFELIDGYFNQTLQDSIQGLVIGGRGIPSVIIACTSCGFLAQHALGALGLLPPKEKEGDK